MIIPTFIALVSISTALLCVTTTYCSLLVKLEVIVCLIIDNQQYERYGITARSDIGFLMWDKDDSRTMRYNIGSRIKTPAYPLWVIKCNEMMGVLFNPNKELMRSHNAENRSVASDVIGENLSQNIFPWPIL